MRLLCVALNYEGTDSELTCRVDAERLIAVARKAGVRDIVRLYDTGDTDRFPCKEEVCALPRSVAEVSWFRKTLLAMLAISHEVLCRDQGPHGC